MPEFSHTEESYVSQRFRWFRRWRIALVLFTVVVWLPVLALLQWKLHITSILQEQGFYWLPGVNQPDLSPWHRTLLRLSYNLEYYTLILMRLIAVGTAIALATFYRPVVVGRSGDSSRIYFDYRHAVRRAVYWAMLMFLLLPSLAAQFVREAGITSEGIDLGVIGYPLLLVAADWFSQCEFQQWLVLRFRRLGFSWYFGLTVMLAAIYFYANYYLQQTGHWGSLSISPHYPDWIKMFLLGFSLATAILWHRHTLNPAPDMVSDVEREIAVHAQAERSTAEIADGESVQSGRARFWVPRKYIYFALSLVAVLGIAYLMVLRSGVLYDPDIYPDPDLMIPVISTRNHLYYGTLQSPHTRYSYELQDSWQRLEVPPDYSGDLLVIVHGFNNPPIKARYKFDLAQSSARSCGYEGLVAGFSWDADTHHDPFSATGYSTGDRQAAMNGPKLARFIADFKEQHPGVRLHLIGYSMGARVVLEALLSLHSDEEFVGSAVVVDSAHLLGASVDSEEVEARERYGAAIEHRSVALFNYHSAQDVALGTFYWIKEADRSLGELCIEHPDARPGNFYSVDASRELVTFDASMNPDPTKLGRNHQGYLGAKDPEGRLVDDGALNLVVANIALANELALKRGLASPEDEDRGSEEQR